MCVNATVSKLSDINEDTVDSLRKPYEFDHQWKLRREFLLKNKDQDMSLDRLTCLSNIFINTEMMGMKYDKSVMDIVRRFSAGLKSLDEYRTKSEECRDEAKRKLEISKQTNRELEQLQIQQNRNNNYRNNRYSTSNNNNTNVNSYSNNSNNYSNYRGQQQHQSRPYQSRNNNYSNQREMSGYQSHNNSHLRQPIQSQSPFRSDNNWGHNRDRNPSRYQNREDNSQSHSYQNRNNINHQSSYNRSHHRQNQYQQQQQRFEHYGRQQQQTVYGGPQNYYDNSGAPMPTAHQPSSYIDPAVIAPQQPVVYDSQANNPMSAFLIPQQSPYFAAGGQPLQLPMSGEQQHHRTQQSSNYRQHYM